jgi:hypothetical protein
VTILEKQKSRPEWRLFPSDQSPSTALVMMLRWISLEPPKIETLR